jgi:hypothetical protein
VRGILVVASAVAIAGCARQRAAPVVIHKAANATTSDPTAPLVSWFGAWNEDTNKFDRKLRFEKVEGQSFGWRMKIRCTGPVRFKEVMKLPAAGDWSFEADDMPGTTISDDKTTTTTIDYAACKQGWIEHVWSVAAGDPAGTYVITVEVDGYAPQVFRPKFMDP